MTRKFLTSPRRRTGALVAIVLTAISVAGLSASAAGKATGSSRYWIVLGSDRDGESRSYGIRPDGSGLRLLLPRTLGSATPLARSGDGHTIAYNVGEGIYVSRANGTGLRRVMRGNAIALSRDGKKIAFSDGSPPHIFVIGTNGRGRRRLTSGYDGEPNWSPDGKAIAYISRSHNRYAVLVQPLHGRRRVLVRGENIGALSWSPDGRWIAYDSGTGHKEALWVVKPNGAQRHVVAHGFVYPFAWSPDGRKIAYELNEKLFVVGVGGGTPRNLHLRRLVGIGALSWSPDGRLLALQSSGCGCKSQIWTVGADGRGLRRLTLLGSNSLIGWTAVAPVPHPVPPLLPSEWMVGANTVATRRPITDLSADADRVAFIAGETGADCEHVAIWTRTTRKLNRFRKPSTSCDGGVYDVELAGSRAAWVEYSGCGNFCDVALDTATLAQPRPMEVYYDSYDANELVDFHLRGDGDLLVYDEGDELLRIGSGPKKCRQSLCTTLRTGPHAADADSVSGGVIAVREREAVAVLNDQGTLVNVLPFGRDEVKSARLDGERLVVARPGVLEVYDARTGAGVLQRPLPAGYALTDVDGGVAVLRKGRTVLLLRLADGRSFTLAPGRGPVLAELEAPGLYYSYATAEDGGRLVFVPRSEIERQLGSNAH